MYAPSIYVCARMCLCLCSIFCGSYSSLAPLHMKIILGSSRTRMENLISYHTDSLAY